MRVSFRVVQQVTQGASESRVPTVDGTDVWYISDDQSNKEVVPFLSFRTHHLFSPGTRVAQFKDGILAETGDDHPCNGGKTD